ncbi:Aste57867_4471 [Aphanomyces stellatus]|uniref:nitric oxide dioxygenase n=1 Tax=Aphanomyces stellatus TaxID=120398 RepID=A0A485KD49_9STRA|nr:hypothetical protein As57867_004459 [Aphanomyces stellatus]VFT81582.1 Aste57867_4471 [Aphanomyces stellatus]
MGGAASIPDGDDDESILAIAGDGSVGLSEAFTKSMIRDMPAPFNIPNPVVGKKHEALIKTNWAAILQGTSAFDPATHHTPTKFLHQTFYRALFLAAPPLRAMFRSSMAAQGKSLATVLESLLTIIHSDDFVTTVQSLATRHLQYGVAKQHYAVFGTVLLETLEIVSGTAWSGKVKDAYVVAYSFLLSVMMPVIQHHDATPLAESIPATITKSIPISPSAKRITLEFAFSLKYHPGDAIWLGLPLQTGRVRRHFTITSFSHDRGNAIDICVQDASASSHWLCAQEPGAVVSLYWVESDVRLEIDEPATLPPHIVFVSYGIGCIPFITMLEGLYRVRDVWKGTVVSLQCAASPNDVAPFNIGVPSAGQPIAWDASVVHYAPTVTAEKLVDIAPNLPHYVLYVNGPTTFVEAAQDAWILAGGQRDRTFEFSFDNNRPFAMSTADLTRGR